MSTRTIEATTFQEGWIGACRSLLDAPGHQATHLVVRMTHPLPEEEQVRAAVEALLVETGYQEVDEVRNTIFPAAIAAGARTPGDLVDDYLEDYDVLRRFAGNTRGTYFGRICEYPHPDGTATPQLLGLIAKLRQSFEGQRRRARYEVNIYAEHKDANVLLGFPCMAHLSFQLGGEASDRLDCVAHYRSQDLIRKGYGNYLGLAELQQYLADTTGFAPGELTVVAGNASLGSGIAALRRMIDGLT